MSNTPMTSAEYAQQEVTKGACCPVCRSYAINSEGGMESWNDKVTLEFSCLGCASTWAQTWVLTGYTDLVRGDTA